MTQEEYDSHPGWQWCTSEGSELHTLLIGLKTTFAEKLAWLEEAETIALTLRRSREERLARSTLPTAPCASGGERRTT